jgi:hypothetical protein
MLLTPNQISRISEEPFSRYLTVAILCSDAVYREEKRRDVQSVYKRTYIKSPVKLEYKVVFNDIRAVSVIFNMLVQIVHTHL